MESLTDIFRIKKTMQFGMWLPVFGDTYIAFILILCRDPEEHDWNVSFSAVSPAI
jgi:hypothetical protein